MKISKKNRISANENALPANHRNFDAKNLANQKGVSQDFTVFPVVIITA